MGWVGSGTHDILLGSPTRGSAATPPRVTPAAVSALRGLTRLRLLTLSGFSLVGEQEEEGTAAAAAAAGSREAGGRGRGPAAEGGTLAMRVARSLLRMGLAAEARRLERGEGLEPPPPPPAAAAVVPRSVAAALAGLHPSPLARDVAGTLPPPPAAAVSAPPPPAPPAGSGAGPASGALGVLAAGGPSTSTRTQAPTGGGGGGSKGGGEGGAGGSGGGGGGGGGGDPWVGRQPLRALLTALASLQQLRYLGLCLEEYLQVGENAYCCCSRCRICRCTVRYMPSKIIA